MTRRRDCCGRLDPKLDIVVVVVVFAFSKLVANPKKLLYTVEGFKHWGGRGYEDFVPGEVTKTVPSGERNT